MKRNEFEKIARDLVEIKQLLYKDELTNEQVKDKYDILNIYIDRIVQASCEANEFDLDSMLLKLEVEARKLREHIRMSGKKYL